MRIVVHDTCPTITAQHSTAQHSIAQRSKHSAHGKSHHSTAQHSTAQHRTLWHSTAQHITAWPLPTAQHITAWPLHSLASTQPFTHSRTHDTLHYTLLTRTNHTARHLICCPALPCVWTAPQVSSVRARAMLVVPPRHHINQHSNIRTYVHALVPQYSLFSYHISIYMR